MFSIQLHTNLWTGSRNHLRALSRKSFLVWGGEREWQSSTETLYCVLYSTDLYPGIKFCSIMFTKQQTRFYFHIPFLSSFPLIMFFWNIFHICLVNTKIPYCIVLNCDWMWGRYDALRCWWLMVVHGFEFPLSDTETLVLYISYWIR